MITEKSGFPTFIDNTVALENNTTLVLTSRIPFRKLSILFNANSEKETEMMSRSRYVMQTYGPHAVPVDANSASAAYCRSMLDMTLCAKDRASLRHGGAHLVGSRVGATRTSDGTVLKPASAILPTDRFYERAPLGGAFVTVAPTRPAADQDADVDDVANSMADLAAAVPPGRPWGWNVLSTNVDAGLPSGKPLEIGELWPPPPTWPPRK